MCDSAKGLSSWQTSMLVVSDSLLTAIDRSTNVLVRIYQRQMAWRLWSDLNHADTIRRPHEPTHCAINLELVSSVFGIEETRWREATTIRPRASTTPRLNG